MNSQVSGFALPTVLVAGLLSMMVLFVALTASSGIRTALDEQYYQQLAREAAESGIIYAQTCLSNNGYLSQWSGKTLTPKTNCSGNEVGSYPSSLSQSGNIETTFVVDSLAATLDPQFITVTGIVNIKRATDGSVWKTITHVQRAQTSSEVGVGSIGFGYRCCATTAESGVFFATITRDGSVMSLGLNNYGQLGHGGLAEVTEPKQFYISDADVRVKQMFASFLSEGENLAALTHGGEVYIAGDNSEGELGVGYVSPYVATPAKMVGLPSGDPVVHIDNLGNATFAITKSGRIFAAGSCTNGSLGLGATCNDTSTMSEVLIHTGTADYRAVYNDTTSRKATFAVDRKGAYVITRNGQVWGWGENAAGQLANGSYTDRSVPTRIGTVFSSSNPAVKVAFDGLTGYFLRADGQLYATGNNVDWELAGSSPSPNTSTLLNITSRLTGAGCATSTDKLIDVVTDRSHVATLSQNGRVCTFGRDNQGQLGHDAGGTAPRRTPKRVDNIIGLPSGVKIVGISVNAVSNTTSFRTPNNTFLVASDGSVYGTGSNHYGQLGRGTTITPHSYSVKFLKMEVFGPDEPAARVQSGMGTTVIYTKSGRVYTVGNNSNGQLGDGTTASNSMPRATKYTNVGPPIFF